MQRGRNEEKGFCVEATTVAVRRRGSRADYLPAAAAFITGHAPTPRHAYRCRALGRLVPLRTQGRLTVFKGPRRARYYGLFRFSYFSFVMAERRYKF